LLLTLGRLLAACGDDAQVLPGDAGPGAEHQVLSDGPPPFSLPQGGSGHGDVAAALSAGQARAGRVTQAPQLLSGLKVQGRVGDYKIYNNRVAFIVADARPVDGFAPYGGKLLDAMRLGQPPGHGQSLIGETIFGLGMDLLSPTSVGVVNDGSDGKPALVRAIGRLAPFPLVASILGTGRGGNLEADIAVDYVLAPDSEVLDIRWRVFNSASAPLQIPLMLGLIAGDGVEFLSEGVGFAVDQATAQDYVGMVGATIGYALFSVENPLAPLLRKEGIWIFSVGDLEAPAAGSSLGEGHSNYKLLLTDGEPEAVRHGMRGLRGESEPTRVSGGVRDVKGTPVAGARVHVEMDSGTHAYVTMVRTDALGAYAMALKPGSYRLTAVAEGREAASPVSISVAAAPLTQDLTVPASSTIAYTVVNEKGQALPVKVVFRPKVQPKALPASFGEATFPSGAPIHFAVTGSGKISLPPGEYTVTASRGFEYEIDQTTVTLGAGESQSVALKVVRSVDTTGYMCGDFHVHAMWSPDSSDLYEMKVAALAAEGLEIPVITEHEYVADLNPTIAGLGLQAFIQGIVGEELTTFVYGHFNPFPVVLDPSKPNHGAMAWFKKSPPQLFADVHATWPDAVLQVNHPRAASIGGYFSYLGYDPKTGTAERAGDWSRQFDAVELFNESGWIDNQDGTVVDWYSFLDRGFPVTATGNSDSHYAYVHEVGYPRNYVKLDTDDPTKLNLVALAKAIKEQRVLVSGGPFVTVSVGGKSLGEVADATSKKVKVAVKVQAPTWMPADTLHIIVGGLEAATVSLDSATADPTNPVVRYNKEIEVPVDKDSWLIAVVTGSGTLNPVSRNDAPFAMTNPIYLDVDGNGVYDPPKTF
jgi:hypothetical protein